jgi:hypothetical protein
MNWIIKDFQENPHRFTLECIAWLLSVGGSAFFAVTNHDKAYLTANFAVWIFGCSLSAWCAFLRRSAPNCLNYIMLAVIDSVGLLNHLQGV